MHSIFNEMLAEYLNEDLPFDTEQIKTSLDELFCKYCQLPYEEWSSGEYGCWNCGLLKNHQIISYHENDYAYERNSFGKILPKGSKSQVTYTKHRGYNPLTHFKEHLRRYMGFRYCEDPDTKEFKTFPLDLCQLVQTKVDLKNPNAYFEVRKVLKKYPKGNKYYKDVFQLIYETGGIRPSIDHKLFEKCVRRFMMFQSKFLRFREEYARHNLPCYYMILEFILKEFGHTPFYHLPHLKDELLAKKIYEIFNDVNKHDV